MLWNRLIDTLFENLESNNIPYSMLEWSDTNETILFIEKNGLIYTTLYDKSAKTFSNPYILTSGWGVSPSRHGDYVVIEFAFNEKVQELSVLYSDIVLGVRSDPMDLWDGLLPWEMTTIDNKLKNTSYGAGGGLHTSDSGDFGGSIFHYDSTTYPSSPLPLNVVIQGIELTWTPAPVDATHNYGTFYRIYEEGVFIGESDTNVFTYIPSPSTDYNVTTVYRHTYQPHDEVETFGTTANSGYQAAGVDHHPLELSPMTTTIDNDTFGFHGVRPIYTEFQYEYSTFVPVTPLTIVINNNGTTGFEDFGLASVDTRIDIIPVFTELLTTEIERNDFDMAVFDIDVSIGNLPFTYTNYYGNFIQ